MQYVKVNKPTPNYSRNKVNEAIGVVFHHTAGGLEGSLEWLTDRRSQVSAHVLIAKDGTQYILASDDKVTWHAGVSCFMGINWCNEFMLGVEFEGNTLETPLTDDQIQSALQWLEERWDKHDFTIEWMTDHRTISPGRKVDLDKTELLRLKIAIAERFLYPVEALEPKELEHIPINVIDTTNLPFNSINGDNLSTD